MYHFNEASGTHQRLLAQLGIGTMSKSQGHADMRADNLHAHLSKDGNRDDQAKAPSNPGGVIRRSSPDVTLTAAQRAHAERAQKSNEREYERRRRAVASGTNGDRNPEDDLDDNELDENGLMAGSSLTKSQTPGSFERLRRRFQAGASHVMNKSLRVGSDEQIAAATFEALMKSLHGDGGKSQQGSYGTEEFMRDLQRAPAIKPATTALSKSIDAARSSVSKTLGVSPMKSLNQKMAAIANKLGNEQLAKSIGTGGPVRGLRMSTPRYSADQIEQASIAAMRAGVLDGETAGVIGNLLALGGAAAVPSAIIRLLEGQD